MMAEVSAEELRGVARWRRGGWWALLAGGGNAVAEWSIKSADKSGTRTGVAVEGRELEKLTGDKARMQRGHRCTCLCTSPFNR